MSRNNARRVERQRLAAAELGMSLGQWRAWKAQESVDRPVREHALWAYSARLNRAERDARIAAGKTTVFDTVSLFTEAFQSQMQRGMENIILYGRAEGPR